MSATAIVLIILNILISSCLVLFANGWGLFIIAIPFIIYILIAGKLSAKFNLYQKDYWPFMLLALIEALLATLVYWNGGHTLCMVDICNRDYVSLASGEVLQALALYTIAAIVLNLLIKASAKKQIKKNWKKGGK